MGERHVEAYSHIKDAEVVGFADIVPEKLNSLAKRFKKKKFSIEEMCTNESIDAVDICTPNVYHSKNSIYALKYGKNVLVEKPMALTLEDCDKMIKQSEKNKATLMIGHTYRFYPSTLKAKEIIDSKEIGKIKMILGYGLDPGQLPGRSKTPKWALNKEEGGGVFFDSIHGVDKFRFWLNSEVSSVYVPIMDKFDTSSSAEQMGIAMLSFENGVIATTMSVSPTWGIRDTGDKIVGTKGVLYTTYGEEVKVGKKDWKYYSFNHQSHPASYEHNLQGFINELSEFVSSIKEKRLPLVTGIEGKKNLAVILAMYKSAKTKKVINI